MAVASAGTFTEAAERLGRSQPAVSMQIRALEEELGLALVETAHRRLQLTPAGRELLQHAQAVLADVERADLAMERIRTGGGPLRIGASATPAIYLLPERLGPFVREHPDVSLRLRVGNPAELEEDLASGEIDIAVAMGGIDDPPWGESIETIGLGLDQLLVALPPGDPRAGYDLSLAQLAAERLILREPDSHLRSVVDRAMGPAWRPTLEFGSSEAVKRAVASGLGVAVISGIALSWEVEAGRLSAATCSALGGPRRIYGGRQRDRRPLMAERGLWDALRAHRQ